MPRWLILPLVLKEIRSIRDLFKDKQAPLRYKLLVIGGLIYLISPIDLIPAPILGFSIIDDCVLWGAILYYLKDPLGAYTREREGKSRVKSSKYKGKTIIRDVSYRVHEEEPGQEKEKRAQKEQGQTTRDENTK